MSAYADTSFLYSLYVQQAHSARAAAYMATADRPLSLTTLGRFLLLNAIRLSVFRQLLDPRSAIVDIQTLEGDIRSGILELTPGDWPAVHADATVFLTFDQSQTRLASAEGLAVYLQGYAERRVSACRRDDER